MATHRIFLSVKDLVILTGNTYMACWREFQIIKDSLGKSKKHKVTIDEYANYEGISSEEIKRALGVIK
ncbi:MAG: hypothetical protein M0R21_12420 [Lentimicrobiaceae bacterium]|jgi:hypothetical protein|nr:hypothetical protein [Lentimicrobiaceae bacterium]